MGDVTSMIAIFLLFATVIFCAWVIFFLIPPSYKGVNIFKLSRKIFLSTIPEGDREKLKYVRISVSALVFTFLYLIGFSILMKILSFNYL